LEQKGEKEQLINTTPNMIDMAKLDAFIATIDDGLRVRPQDCVRGKCGNLVAMIEARISNVQERRALCQLLADAQPSQSKWVFLIKGEFVVKHHLV
jgi:hypothetical protein